MRFQIRVLSLLAMVLGASAALAQSVQLADGRVLLAEVDASSVNGEGMRVRRLDNGGSLELRWEHLSPGSALDWKKRFNLAGDAEAELTIRADEIEFMNNGSKMSLLGRVDDAASTTETIVLERMGVPHTIKRTDLIARRQVDAPVTQVLTKDQFYADQRSAIAPGDEADKHVQLAKVMERVRDLDHALEHAHEAKRLAATSRNPAEIDALLARLQLYKEAAREAKLLEDIIAARSRGKLADFEKGKALVAQFEKEFPAAKLKAEFDAEKRRFTAARSSFLTGQVAEKWRDQIRYVAEKAAVESSATLQSVRDYATGKMTDDIVARVAAQLKLEADEVKTLWAARKDSTIGKRSEHFYYGVGSWVLGDQAILKGTQAEKILDKHRGVKPGAAAEDPALERVRRALKEAGERRRAAVQGNAGAREQTEEDWWREATKPDRVGWLRAYYAEYGGQLVVTYATVDNCISCFGVGTLADMGPDGKPVRNTCFLCQGKKYTRIIKAY